MAPSNPPKCCLLNLNRITITITILNPNPPSCLKVLVRTDEQASRRVADSDFKGCGFRFWGASGVEGVGSNVWGFSAVWGWGVRVAWGLLLGFRALFWARVGACRISKTPTDSKGSGWDPVLEKLSSGKMGPI